MRKRFVVAAIVTLIALAGCKEDVPGVTCETETDCPGGKCVDGICLESSADASVPDAAVPDASTPDAGPTCTTDGDCGKCEKCSGGACVFQAGGEDLKDECADDLCATGTCDGAGACGLEPVDTPCRAAADDCDVAEACTGTAPECPSDEFAPASKTCRASAGDCDLAEKCTGTSAACPADQFAPATKECRAAADACDKAETCAGNSAACPSDLKQADGTECAVESCSGSTYTAARTCDGNGTCRPAAPSGCAPYVCGATKCKDSCTADADCTEQLCDIRASTCAPAVTPVDCSAAATALQTAIDNCTSGTACYLRVSGTCEKVLVQNKDVFIAGTTGAAIDPTSDGPAVSVREDDGSQPQTTRLAVLGMFIRGASGASGHGIECSGLSGGVPEVAILKSTIGGSGTGEGNSGSGLSATNCAISVSSSKFQYNSGAGIGLLQSGFAIQNTIVSRNGLSGGFGIDVYSTTVGLAKVFRFNTVAGNLSGGMSCAGTHGDTAVLASLFWNPGVNELSGPCAADSASDVPNLQDACGNGENTEPGFLGLVPPNTDFRLSGTSPCIDKVACIPTVTTDIDGESRPLRSSLCDVGADEVP